MIETDFEKKFREYCLKRNIKAQTDIKKRCIRFMRFIKFIEGIRESDDRSERF